MTLPPRSPKRHRQYPESIDIASLESTKDDNLPGIVDHPEQQHERDRRQYIREVAAAQCHPTGPQCTPLDGLHIYGIGDEDSRNRIQSELIRLLDVCINDVDTPCVFPETQLGEGANNNNTNVPAIADQILCNFVICLYDNETILLKDIPALLSLGRDGFREAHKRHRRILQKRLDSSAPQRHPPKLGHQNSYLYFATVDYISAVVTRLCVQSIKSDDFQATLIACMAKLSAKLKYLNDDPVECAKLSLSAGVELEYVEETPRCRSSQDLNKSLRASWEEIWLPDPVKIPTKTFDAAHELDNRRQLSKGIEIRHHLTPIISHILSTLRGGKDVTDFISGSVPGFGNPRVSITTVVFEAAFASHSKMVNQTIDLELQGSSSPECLKICFNAFQILMQTHSSLMARIGPGASNRLDNANWNFEWRLEDMDTGTSQHGALDSNRLDDSAMLSVMVPLICTSSLVANHIAKMIYLASARCHTGKLVEDAQSPGPSFAAFAVLNSNKNLLPSMQFFDTHTVPLDQSSLAKALGNQFPSERQSRTAVQTLDKRLQNDWEIHQDYIKARCATYVLGVLAFCVLLVTGATLLGRAKEDEPGWSYVSPMTMFVASWGIAGTVIVISKAKKSEEWTWVDYVHLRCPCRSVSDLSALSKIDPQLVLSYLLQNEDSTLLRTTGPFSGPFRRNKEGVGFCIDIKPNLKTLQSCGLIFAKVATAEGQMLVCLRIDCGTQFASLPSTNYSMEDGAQLLVCFETTHLNEERTYRRSRSPGSQDFDMSLERPHWYKILGIYNNLDSTFRGNIQASSSNLEDNYANVDFSVVRDSKDNF